MSSILNIVPLLAQGADPGTAVAAAGAVFFIFALAFVMMLVFSAIFIHLATGLLGFAQTFGTAVKAVLWQILFGIVFAILLGIFSAVLPVLLPAAPMLAQWLGATFGIRQAYNAGFFKSLVAAIISAILSVVAVVILVIILAIATGISMQQLQDEIEKRQKPTISAEFEPRALQALPERLARAA